MEEYKSLGLYPIPIEKSIEILKSNIQEIPTVNSWAELMGYSRSYFSTCFTHCFGEPPSKCLCRIRYRQLHKKILKYPHITSRAVACELGLKDEKALYKFLSRHYDTNFTEVREKLLNGNE
jgi:AraC-like DNA-binding protein